MNNKLKPKNRKWIIPTLVALTGIGCISIGFASWAIPPLGDKNNIEGNFVAETIAEADPNKLPVVSITGLQPFQYQTGYGFVSDLVYSKSVQLTGTCSFNSENAKLSIASYEKSGNNDLSYNKFSMTISLSSSLSGGLLSNGFTSSDISLFFDDGVTSSVSGDSIVNTTNIYKTFRIVVDEDSDFTFAFSITLNFDDNPSVSGVDLSKFPNLADADLSVSFSLGEYL